MYSIVIGAYGKMYTTKKQIESDFRNGVDMRLLTDSNGNGVNQYCSIRDFKKGEKIEVRFGKFLSKHVIIEV